MPDTAQIGGIGPFEISSVSFAPQHASVTPNAGGTTRAQVSDVTITKPSDANSAALMRASAQGTVFDSATVTMNSSGGGPKVLQFSGVAITAFSSSSSRQGADPIDSMNWNFSQMNVQFSQYDDPDSASGGTCSGSFDDDADSDDAGSGG